MKRFIITALIASILCSTALARTKSDIVSLNNGDRVTGEIKNLEHGKLRISTDSMGEVLIEWDNIVSIESDFDFQFESTDGLRIVGQIEPTRDPKMLAVKNDEGSIFLAHDMVVRISPIERSFWDSVKGSATFGYSFTKASDVEQLNLGFRASHRTEVRSFSIDGKTITTNDQADQSTQRSELIFNMTRFRRNRWFNSYILGFESNDELGLKLRSSLGAGFGRYIIQTSTSELALLGGVVGTAEELSSGASSQENIEGLIMAEFSRYIFDDPKVDMSLRLSVFPSITESGRIRGQFDANIRRELIKDLYWDLSFYETYDSDPPSGSLSTNDYGIITSLGWSF